jgi:hypothetical protein
MLRKIIICFLVILLSGLCACNLKDTTDKLTESGRLIEPCELISKTEAETLLGVKLKDAVKTEQEVVGLKLCFYESEDTDRFLQVGLTQEAFMKKEILDAGQSPDSIFTEIMNNTVDTEKADGIGDEAFIGIPGIHILMDGYYITIGLGNSDNAENREKLKEAGKIASGNLKKLIVETGG